MRAGNSTLMTWRSVGWRLALAAALAWPTIATAQDTSPFKRFDDFPPDDFVAALGWSGGGAGSEGTFCQLNADGQLLGEPPSAGTCTLGLNDILEVVVGDNMVKRGWSQTEPVPTSPRSPDAAPLE